MENVEFLPERIKLQRARRKRLIRQAYLMVLFVAGLAALGYTDHLRLQQAKAELGVVHDQRRNVQQQLAMKQSLEKQQADLMIMQRVEEHLGSRVNALDVLAEIQRLLPDSMALTSLNMETMEAAAGAVDANASAAANASKAKRVRLVITGLAPNDVEVANFIGQLSSSPLLEDINMGYAKNVTYRGRSAREFQVSCYITR